MTALKFDTDKPRMELLPFDALREVAKVLTFGASKYAAHNWKEGMNWSRLEGAILRHYAEYQERHDIDPESGRLHLAHLACDALFLLSYQVQKVGTDDRYTPDEGFIPSPEDLAINAEIGSSTAYNVYDRQGYIAAKLTNFELSKRVAKLIGGSLKPSNLNEFTDDKTTTIKEF